MREEKARLIPERFKAGSPSRELAAKAALLYYVNTVCLPTFPTLKFMSL